MYNHSDAMSWPESPNYIICDNGDVFNSNTNRYLKGKIDNVGYRVYTLKVNGKSVYKYAHRLVAETFIPNPNNLPVVKKIIINI